MTSANHASMITRMHPERPGSRGDERLGHLVAGRGSVHAGCETVCMIDPEQWRAAANKIADDTLFPAALAVDRGEQIAAAESRSAGRRGFLRNRGATGTGRARPGRLRRDRRCGHRLRRWLPHHHFRGAATLRAGAVGGEQAHRRPSGRPGSGRCAAASDAPESPLPGCDPARPRCTLRPSPAAFSSPARPPGSPAGD